MKLTAEDMSRIEEAIPASAVAGSRYDERQMRMLDSGEVRGVADNQAADERG